jgi:aspartyl-tRNA(Asn)/glutamyl-tRNA(Gln) amidotransferase subunit C
MAPKLPREEVAHIAALARLDLTEQELETFAGQLGDILTFASAIQQVDTSRLPPDETATEAPATWRDDRPAASLDRDEVLGAAPDARAADGYFRVPKVL